jgi:hypothetical protein
MGGAAKGAANGAAAAAGSKRPNEETGGNAEKRARNDG